MKVSKTVICIDEETQHFEPKMGELKQAAVKEEKSF
jgi:hypothetical protein